MNVPLRKSPRALILTLGVGGVALALGTVALVSADETLSTSSAQVAPPEVAPAPARPRVFIAGSRVNLREAPSPTATVVSQLLIATECTVEEKAPSGWWRIGCGDVQGWAASEFLSEERPTVEALLAVSEDPMRPLKEQFDAARRAVTLDPEHPGARDRFWKLFVEQELVQVEDLLAKGNGPRPQLHASITCKGEGTSAEICLEDALDRDWWGTPRSWRRVWRRFETQHRERESRHMFVSAALENEEAHLGRPPTPQQLLVRVGTFEGDAKNLDVQVFTVSRYAPDTWQVALAPTSRSEREDKPSELSKLEGKLSQEELGLLSSVAGKWTQVTRSGKEIVIRHTCGEHVPRLHLQLDEDHGHAHMHLDVGNGDGLDFEVMRVQSAKDGSVSLSNWDGHRLTYSASRNDEFVVNWKTRDVEHLSGPFVREEEEGRFRTITTECDE